MGDLELAILFACILVVLSILASKVTGRWGIPALLLFLGIGMAAGSEGIGGIYFDDAHLAQSVGVVALALILFSGGLDTHFATIRPVLTRGIVLATVGTLVAAGLLGLFVAAVSDLPLKQSLLLGAVVSSTDAAAVFAVLRARSVHLPVRVRGLLELESGSNDPMAVFLTIALVAILTEGQVSPWGLVASFVLQMGLGGALGYVLGRAMAAIMNRVDLEQEGLYPVLSLALVLLTFAATSFLGGSGFLAVYIAGLVMANRAFIHKRSLTRFHDGLAWLMQIAMFLTLGLLVFPRQILSVLGLGVLCAAFLMLVARPLSVYLSLAASRFSFREQTLIGWVGLRGAVPIILATFPLVAGVSGANTIFNVVFFIVLASALVQGTTIPFVARRLRVEGPAFQPEPIAIGEPVQRRLVEYRVPPDSPLVGHQIAQAGFPAEAQVVLLRRYDSYIVSRGSTRLRRDDILMILADEESQRRIDDLGQLTRELGPLSVCKVDGHD